MSELRNSKETELFTIAIADLDRSQTQLRAKMDPQAVEDYAAAMKEKAKFPPVTVIETAEDGFILGDGFHRCEAAESIGRVNIDCVVERGTLEDAILFAATANSHNAVRFSSRDKRNAVVRVRESHPKMTLRDLAEACGVSYGIVQDVNKKMKNGNDPLVADARNGDDKDGDDKEPAAKKTPIDHLVDAVEKLDLCFIKARDGGFFAPGSDSGLTGAITDLEAIVREMNALGAQIEPSNVTRQDDDKITAVDQSDHELDPPDDDYDDVDDSVVLSPKRARADRRMILTPRGAEWWLVDDWNEAQDRGPFPSKNAATKQRKVLNKQLFEGGAS